jgi:hypothetical protein
MDKLERFTEDDCEQEDDLNDTSAIITTGSALYER